jgi:hypothetical protein
MTTFEHILSLQRLSFNGGNNKDDIRTQTFTIGTLLLTESECHKEGKNITLS